MVLMLIVEARVGAPTIEEEYGDSGESLAAAKEFKLDGKIWISSLGPTVKL